MAALCPTDAMCAAAPFVSALSLHVRGWYVGQSCHPWEPSSSSSCCGAVLGGEVRRVL